MPVLFQPAQQMVAMWDDVLAIFGKPYSVCRIASLHSNTIKTARDRGYFYESASRRLHEASMGRLKLVPIAEARKIASLKGEVVE